MPYETFSSGPDRPDAYRGAGAPGAWAPRPVVLAGRSSGKANAALVCGLLAFPLMHLVAGICAIIIGKRELRAIDEGRSDPANRGKAQAGVVLGIIGILIACLVFGLQVLAHVLGAVAH